VLLCAAAVALQAIVWMVILSIVARYVAMYRGGRRLPTSSTTPWSRTTCATDGGPTPSSASSTRRWRCPHPRASDGVVGGDLRRRVPGPSWSWCTPATAVVTDASGGADLADARAAAGAGRGLRLRVAAIGLTALNRYDGTVALIVAATVLCLVCRRWAWAGLLVGLGFSLKLMPIVLLPLALGPGATLAAGGVRRGARRGGAILPFRTVPCPRGAAVWTALFAGQAGRRRIREPHGDRPYLLAQVVGLGH